MVEAEWVAILSKVIWAASLEQRRGVVIMQIPGESDAGRGSSLGRGQSRGREA